MSKNVKIRRGANIKLEGVAQHIKAESSFPGSFAIKPTDFHGLTPKMMVKEGAEVKAGTPLFFDKYNERIKFTSPVSGEVAEIVRGEKRRILEVRIVADQVQQYEQFNVGNVNALTSDQVKDLLLSSGLWPFLKQRPYDVVANPDRTPKAIFISAFDSAPLAPDYNFIMQGQGEAFQRGLDVLAKLTPGKVHLNTRGNGATDDVFSKAKSVQVNTFSGPHPAGNPGVQIHHVTPINKGEVVWTISPQAVLLIGKFFASGRLDVSKTVALAGSEVQNPRYIKTWLGASIKSLLEGQLKPGDNRIISGNVLTGTRVSMEGYLGFYDDLLTVIPEGREPQFMGWLAPNFNKFSLSRGYFSWLMPGKRYDLNTNTNGEDRPFVVTGQYENLLPMDVYPVQLVKSIITNDIEKMEQLGIYEVAPEDFALCEFACTSKMNLQEIVREGLDVAMKELG